MNLIIEGLDETFRTLRGHLFGISYRLTGSVEDSEDIVQETFVRAIRRPPRRTDEPWRPWLTRVAVNLSIDRLRHRKRWRYVGPWLPDPIDTGNPSRLEDLMSTLADVRGPSARVDAAERPDKRYELLESITYAFLTALEALDPRQRVVLVLRDVFDYSSRETGEILGIAEGNVRVVLHRARRAMRAYDSSRCRPTRGRVEATRQVLQELVRCLTAGDAERLRELLAADALTVTDGGNRYTALKRPMVGRQGAMRLFLRVAKRRSRGADIALGLVNGLPAAVIEFAHTVRRQAPCAVLRCEVDDQGLICEINVILGPEKIADVLPPRDDQESRRSRWGGVPRVTRPDGVPPV